MTKEGYEKLQARLKYLKEEVLPKIEESMGIAIQHGDVSDSGDYRAAREEMWRLDQEISEIQDKLSRAVIVNTSTIAKDRIAFGATVKVKDLQFDEMETFTLVGPGETDLSQNKISIDSPIGSALVGHKVGDIVEIQVPAGKVRYEIVEFTW